MYLSYEKLISRLEFSFGSTDIFGFLYLCISFWGSGKKPKTIFEIFRGNRWGWL